MYQYSLDPEDELRLARPSSEEISQTAAQQVAPAANNTDFLKQAMDVLKDRRAQSQPIQRRMPADPQRPDVAGDDWRMLLAMGLNILGNKGKDLGQIAMAGTQQRNQRIDQYNAQVSPEAKLKREMQLAELSKMDRSAQTDEVREASELASQLRADYQAKEGTRQFDTREARAGAEHNDDMLYKGLDVQDRRAKMELDNAQFGQRLTLDERKLAEDARQSRAQIGLGYGNLQLNRDQLAEQRRYHSGMLANDAAENATKLEIEKAKAGLGDASQYMPAGITEASPAFQRSMIKGGEERNKMLEKIGLQREYMGHLKTLEDIRARPKSPENERLYKQQIAKFIGGLAQSAGSGTLDKSEYERYNTTFPEYTSANPKNSTHRRIIQGMTSPSAAFANRDIAAEQFNAMRSQAADEYKRTQELYGFKDSYNPWGDEKPKTKLTDMGIPGLTLRGQ